VPRLPSIQAGQSAQSGVTTWHAGMVAVIAPPAGGVEVHDVSDAAKHCPPCGRLRAVSWCRT